MGGRKSGKNKRQETPQKNKEQSAKQAKVDSSSSDSSDSQPEVGRPLQLKLTDANAMAMDLGLASALPIDNEQNNAVAPMWFRQFELRLDARLAKLCDNFNQALELHTENCDREIQNLHTELNKALDKIDDLENRSRRNNVVIFGVPEGVETNPSNCSDFVSDTLLKFIDPDNTMPKIDIQRAHRTPTGPARMPGSKPRPIHVFFSNYQQKEMVRKTAIATFKSKKFRDSKLFISDDLSKRVQAQRKEALPDYRKLRDDGLRPFFSYPAILKYWDSGSVKIFKK